MLRTSRAGAIGDSCGDEEAFRSSVWHPLTKNAPQRLNARGKSEERDTVAIPDY
jgi:hypothetical protein